MRAIEIIAEEHRYIERMLACLQLVLHETTRRGRVESDVAAPLVALFEYFADGTHQRKEEAVLFARLLELAGLEEKVCLSKLLGEHEGERRMMRDLRSNLLGAIHGVPEHVGAFLRTGASYLELHARHIAKENEILLPMASRLLDPATDRYVQDGFESIDRQAGVPDHEIFDRIDAIHARLAGAPGMVFPDHLPAPNH
jgi:hemerythrin-like domain-containing protein